MGLRLRVGKLPEGLSSRPLIRTETTARENSGQKVSDDLSAETVIRVEDRDAYLTALDRASIDGDIGPFAAFISVRVKASIKNQTARTRRRTTAKHPRSSTY
jgi:hypothetical protein